MTRTIGTENIGSPCKTPGLCYPVKPTNVDPWDEPTNAKRTITDDLNEELCLLSSMENIVDLILEKIDGKTAPDQKESCEPIPCIARDITEVLDKTERIRKKLHEINGMI